jgi:peptide/nickel transport system permease protein
VWKYVLRRIVESIPVVLVVSVVIFSVTRILPGDPTYIVLGEYATEAQRAALRQDLGLNDPIVLQYLKWIGSLLSGDFGHSLRSHEPIVDMLRSRLPVTIELTLLSMLLAISIGVPCGVIAARKRNTLADVLASTAAMVGMALPFFWLGMLLIMLLSVCLGLLPPSGYVPFWVDPVANLKSMIMPVITIGTAMAGTILRQTRTAMLQVLSQDYVRTARSKGAHEFVVVMKHALRNALIPVATVVGLETGSLLGGAIVTEAVFSLPGLGSMVVGGIFGRDFPVVQGAITVIVTAVLVVNLITDLLYAALDPRIKLA